jgi:crotonobetainyl-CoA:carnitine CoA-transferase CaiB-like acyl-CoA transferase
VRVLELSENLVAAYAGMLLADLGWDVVKVEAPEGDPWRQKTSDVGDDSPFVYANRRKRSVSINLASSEGIESLLALASKADALVEDLGPGALAARGITYEGLQRRNPGLVLASIAPFGASGPHAGWQASELVVQAMGGVVHNTGWEDSPPLKLAGYAAAFVAGINAATSVLAATYGVAAGTEPGVHIDLSMQETFAHHWTRHIAQWCYAGTGTRRERREQGRQGFPHSVPTADGMLYILALRAEWEALAFFLGLEPFISHEFSDPAVRAARWPEIEPHFYESLRSKGRYEWFADAAAEGYTFAPIDDPLAILASPQLGARGYFEPVEVEGAWFACPGLPFSFDSGPRGPNRAPRPGEHTAEVLGEWAQDPGAAGRSSLE